MLINTKRVLFIMSEYTNLLEPVSYKDNQGRLIGNTGNMAFRIAGLSYFFSDKLNVQFETLEDIEKHISNDSEWGRENFDLCVILEANCFSEVFHTYVKEKFDKIRKIGVPIYVLGAGAQSGVDYGKSFLKQEVSDDIKYIIDLILASGGDITLRGEFTGEVLKELGYPDLFVSGCPSLYINGRDYRIIKKEVSEKEFRPMLVSSDGICEENAAIFNEYPKSTFFDQDSYMAFLYAPEEVKEAWRYLQPVRLLYSQNRIKGDVNYIPWCNQIVNGGYHFSYGNRVHGNILALHNGVPAYILAKDSRTREIAEFYKIPNSVENPHDAADETLYELYQRLDYEEFNRTYKNRFDALDKYLTEKGIPNVLGENHAFINYLKNLTYYDYSKDESVLIQKGKLIKKLPKTDLAKCRIKANSLCEAVKWKIEHFGN